MDIYTAVVVLVIATVTLGWFTLHIWRQDTAIIQGWEREAALKDQAQKYKGLLEDAQISLRREMLKNVGQSDATEAPAPTAGPDWSQVEAEEAAYVAAAVRNC